MKESGSRFSLFLMELVIDLFLFVLCAAVCVGLLLHAPEHEPGEHPAHPGRVPGPEHRGGPPGGRHPAGSPEGYRCEVSQTEDSGLSTAEIEIFWGDTSLYTLETSWISTLSSEEVAQP